MARKPLQDLRGSLLLIGMVAQQRPELVVERLDLLLKVGCQPFAHLSAQEASVCMCYPRHCLKALRALQGHIVPPVTAWSSLQAARGLHVHNPS